LERDEPGRSADADALLDARLSGILLDTSSGSSDRGEVVE